MLSQEAWADVTQDTQRRTCDILPSPSHIDPGSSIAQRDEAAGSLSHRPVLPQDFADASETCFFWLFDPKRFLSVDTHAYSGQSSKMSHLVSHAIDHHGLIRGCDPQYIARKYLAGCQSSNSFVKVKGDCVKCSSLSEWNDRDFADFTHHGVAVCLRCWRKFDKKEMKEHMARPLYDYNTEQPKAKKVWSLYTAFCSETQLPSKPPGNMPRRKSAIGSVQRHKRSYRRQFGQDRTAAPVDDLDATVSMSCPSLATSTTGESMELWHSPKLSGSWVLQEEADDMAFDSLERNPSLRVTIEAADPPPLRPTDRPQELACHIPADQHQKNSGYHPENVDDVLNTEGLDIELNQVDLNDLNEMFG
ncbi:hypothetical protein FAGAP_3284 [Fusarium agapanthi]|uniref:Uncharacterized protein n=1 Tax=Fusarium agapanthi TaxID=1803897 RepID=A0A9P5BDV4_9HYPO|nr:hypothetical protein FAGAP_3284 [Fusarium agapanthi]